MAFVQDPALDYTMEKYFSTSFSSETKDCTAFPLCLSPFFLTSRKKQPQMGATPFLDWNLTETK
jgi:hypothetical protein